MIYDGDYYVGSDLNGDSLSHHGVPKQKWGVRNGPPYPIKRGSEVHYSVGKMTEKTKAGLKKAGKIASSGAKAVGKAAKTAGAKVNSSFQKWKEAKKEDLVTRPTNSMLMKNWQKRQLRISDMSSQELQQRIDRKRLEESYKRALRGDFSDPKTWNKASKDAKSSGGKSAADSILRRVGDAAIDGLAKGLTDRIAQTMTAKQKAKVARREARRDAIEEVMRDAAKERAQYRAERSNQDWKERQERKEKNREYWRSTRATDAGDGAMDPVTNERRRTRAPGLYSTSYYYAGPNEGRVR